MNEGRKYDQGKARFDLIPPRALLQIARVMTYGAHKYGVRTWPGVESPRYIAAAERHINAYLRGEKLDSESGLPHLAHAAVSLMFVTEMDKQL